MSSAASFSQIIFADADGRSETGWAMWAVVVGPDGIEAELESPLHPASNVSATIRVATISHDRAGAMHTMMPDPSARAKRGSAATTC
jgi:hypothetical protein